MNKLTLSKLSSLSSSLTPKEEAKIVIGYLVKQDKGEGSYENEIKTIVSAISPANSNEYNFYWHMYMNTQQILLDYQTAYLQLQVQIGRLVFFRYMMHLSLLLVYTNRFHRLSKGEKQKEEYNTHGLCERMFSLIQIMEILPQKDIDTIRFTSKEIKEIFTDMLFVIRGLLQRLVNYQNLFYMIEEKVFDGMEIITRKGLWEDINKYIQEVITEHNTAMSEFIEKSENLAYPSKVSFIDMPKLMLERPKIIDEKWIHSTFRELIAYAERDSRWEVKI